MRGKRRTPDQIAKPREAEAMRATRAVISGRPRGVLGRRTFADPRSVVLFDF